MSPLAGFTVAVPCEGAWVITTDVATMVALLLSVALAATSKSSAVFSSAVNERFLATGSPIGTLLTFTVTVAGAEVVPVVSLMVYWKVSVPVNPAAGV